jgi:hypothetical protein
LSVRAIVARISKMVGELKRRKVFRVGSLYLVTIWGLSLGAAELLPTFGVPDWAVRYLVITLFLGLPIALVLAWAFEVRPEGVMVDSGAAPLAKEATDAENAADARTTLITSGRPHLSISWQNGQDGQTANTRAFNNNLTIGRHPDNDICITESSVSRRHAKISYVDSGWIIEDLGSQNGTLLNGALIEKADLPGRSEVRLSDESQPIVIENNDISLAATKILPRGNNS